MTHILTSKNFKQVFEYQKLKIDEYGFSEKLFEFPGKNLIKKTEINISQESIVVCGSTAM